MSRLLFLGAVFLLCAALALVAGAAYHWVASPATEAIRQADVAYWIERGRQDLAFRDAIFPVVVFASSGVVVSGAVLLVLGLVRLFRMIEASFARRGQLVYPDKRGLLPADLARLQAGDYDQHAALALYGHHHTQATAAANPPVSWPNLPQGWQGSFAPRVFNTGARRSDPAPTNAPAPAPALPPVEIPTFARLLADGKVTPGRIVVGFDPQGALLSAPPTDFVQVGICGTSGSGKTHTAAGLIAQAAVGGARFGVLDPHYQTLERERSLARKLEPLRAAAIAPYGVDPDTMLVTVERFDAELARRQAGAAGPWWYLVADEWTALMRRSDLAERLARIAEALTQEGAKFHMGIVLLGQTWSVDSAGGSAVRDSLNTIFVHRSKSNQAHMVMPDIKARDVLDLQPGQAILDTPSSERVVVSVPYITNADLRYVAGLLPAPATPVGGGASDDAAWDPVSPGRTVDGGRSDAQNEAETGQNTDRPRPTAQDRPPLKVIRPTSLIDKARTAGMALGPDEWRDLMMMDAGQTPQAIAARETGATEGRPYRRRRDELVKLADLVRNWPDGDPAAPHATASNGGVRGADGTIGKANRGEQWDAGQKGDDDATE